MKKVIKHIEIISELAKVKITSFVAISTSVGYVLFSGKLTLQMLFLDLGVFFLACGSSSLNHYQERKSDALMKRTKGRPIPSGKVSPLYALNEFIILSVGGLIIIYLTSNLTAVILGLLALLWYNGIYTPLKEKICFSSCSRLFNWSYPAGYWLGSCWRLFI